MVANIVCPKCGGGRTRRVGPLSVDYRRCDACEYLFRDSDESRREPEPLMERSTVIRCGKCGSPRVRMVAHPHLIQINTGLTGDFSLLLSNNHSTGGTCFGDSGGPNFLGDSNVIAGVTSYGLNGTCGGTGGVFRLDRQNVLNFVSSFLN